MLLTEELRVGIDHRGLQLAFAGEELDHLPNVIRAVYGQSLRHGRFASVLQREYDALKSFLAGL